MRVPFVLMVLSLKLLQVICGRRPSLGTSTPRTEVRVRSRWPVAIERALSAYSVNLLILYYVWNERDVELSAAKTLKLDVLVLEPLLCNLNSIYGCAYVMVSTCCASGVCLNPGQCS